METVAPGVYVETRYASGNVGAIVTGVGIVCIDVPMLPSDVEHWRSQLRSMTDEPIVALSRPTMTRSGWWVGRF